MPSLPDELFALLENKTLQAREAAEKAARNILAYLKVESSTWWGKKEDSQRDLWLGLRARARQLGYSVEENGEKDPVKRGLPQLVEEIAYEQWHRMLFARFLAENNLLMHPSGVAVSLAECEELAPEEGEDDAWRLAARYAGAMLPGIFKQEDPCAQVRLTPSDHHALESILLEIPPLVFSCDDSLGWMYQFWQSKKKKEVNDSERKIGGADISPVTQLFTEDYMVRFLLENSLGAWWAARHPESSLVKEWEYLRCRDDGTPAAGSFPGWPECAAEVTVMDPCCGSGHFLVAAFDMLRRMRMEEERLDAAEAARRTLKDNIFGLEIDQRCTQIAWFALSLVGWKSGGYQPLSDLNIACTGIPVKGQLNDWLALAGNDSRVKAGLERLYNLFINAPDLGSLINPIDLPLADRMFVAEYDQVEPMFKKALVREQVLTDDKGTTLRNSTTDLIKAVRLLSRKFNLVITNVPYLGLKKQNEVLKQFCIQNYQDSKSSLATVFVERCRSFAEVGGSYALVAPLDWRSLSSYKRLRKRFLSEQLFNVIVNLGLKAFRTPMWDLNIGLWIITNAHTSGENTITGIDTSSKKSIASKIVLLKKQELHRILQSSQFKNSDYRITLDEVRETSTLGNYVWAPQGIKTGDDDKWRRFFWEIPKVNRGWEFYQSTVSKNLPYGGREHIINWQQNGIGMIRPRSDSVVLGKRGIAISQMGDLYVTLYTGERFDSNVAPIVPKDPQNLHALWSFCQSSEFKEAIRKIDSGLKINNGTILDIEFNLSYWKSKAEIGSPIPIPYSDDPTQWVFNGIPSDTSNSLQVSVIRYLGYSWPQQNPIDSLVNIDQDGIIGLPAVNGEPPAVERLRTLLAASYGSEWSAAKQEELLAGVGYSGKDLADWLRDGFFEQHCKLFQNRPFIWHIWDGRKDGFSALVNYHKLDRANLEKLTYTYLGTWIADHKKDMEKGIAGAEGRLLAAQSLQDKLKLILAGEPPYDIYVRWKPLHEQPIGWEPDLNDGVRLNIRPFVSAGVLRSRFTIDWDKDRGKNPDGSERLNDLHFTVAEKRAAREKKLR